MDSHKKPSLLERNPRTYSRHRQEVIWQITLPLIVGVLLLLAIFGAVVFSATQPVTELERWASVSLMWLILPSLFLALIILAILIGFAYLFSITYRAVPKYARIVQLYAEQVKAKISQLSNLLAEPVLRMHGFLAMVHRIVKLGREVQE